MARAPRTNCRFPLDACNGYFGEVVDDALALVQELNSLAATYLPADFEWTSIQINAGTWHRRHRDSNALPVPPTLRTYFSILCASPRVWDNPACMINLYRP